MRVRSYHGGYDLGMGGERLGLLVLKVAKGAREIEIAIDPATHARNATRIEMEGKPHETHGKTGFTNTQKYQRAKNKHF